MNPRRCSPRVEKRCLACEALFLSRSWGRKTCSDKCAAKVRAMSVALKATPPPPPPPPPPPSPPPSIPALKARLAEALERRRLYNA